MERTLLIRRFFVVLLAMGCRLPTVASAEPLPHDPNNTYGQLDNGVRYIVRRNQNPPGRVTLYLHVRTGALNESDQQNGLAHFLEHLAFNGSKHYPPGTLVPHLNKLGMQFGADTNAHTNQHETVYKLNMPDNKPETIADALTIFADYAGGLLLNVEEIEKERKVILEESRARKSAQERLQKQWRRLMFPDMKVSRHDVIGDETQIAAFPKSEFEDYWNTWYRPENLTLIVVGDIEPADIEKTAKKHLGELAPRGPARTPGKTGIEPGKNPPDKPRAFVLSDPEQVMAQVQLVCVLPGRKPMTTFADYRFNEIENMGTWIVSRRLREMINAGTAKFRGAGVSVGSMEHDAITPRALAMGEPADWNAMLEQVIVEINRACEHGFTKGELELAQKELLANARRAVQTEKTLSASALVNRFSSAVGQDEPILSAAQNLELLERILKDVSADEVHAVFSENYKTKNYTYSLMMPEPKEGDALPSEQDVLAAAAEAWSRKVEPPTKAAGNEQLLAKLPAGGDVAEKRVDAELEITTAKLSNGVIVHHRFMEYKKDSVLVSLTMPGGSIEETDENRGASEVASILLNRPATSRLSSTQITDLLTGKNVSVRGGVGSDTLTISITGSPADLETGFQLAYALLTDARLEQAAYDNWYMSRLRQIEQMEKTPQGHMMKLMARTVYGGDVRFTPLSVDQVEKMKPETGLKWFQRIVATRPMEVAVVGEIQADAALALCAKYLGALPQRSAGFDCLDKLRKIERGSGPYKADAVFESVTPKATALGGFLGCDDANVVDRRKLQLVSRILSDRMVKRIREEEQLVYSIGCSSQAAQVIPGTGMIIAMAPTDPQNGAKLADTIIEMMRAFAKDGPTAEELATAKKQTATRLETTMKEPSWWHNQLGEMVYRKHELAELRDLPGVFETFTAKDLQATAAKYMTDERMIRIVVTPESLKDAPADKVAPAKKKPAATEG